MKPPIGQITPLYVNEFRVDVPSMGTEVLLSFRAGTESAVVAFTSEQSEDLAIGLYRANYTAAKARFAIDRHNHSDPDIIDQVIVVANSRVIQTENAVLIEVASTVREPQRLLIHRDLARELLIALQDALGSTEKDQTAH